MVGLKYMNCRGLERDINWASFFHAKIDKSPLCNQALIHHRSLTLKDFNA